MKKIALLFTLTLCAGALNGMEQPKTKATAFGLGEIAKASGALTEMSLCRDNKCEIVPQYLVQLLSTLDPSSSEYKELSLYIESLKEKAKKQQQ